MVYVGHFSEPFGHAKHYWGSTPDHRLDQRGKEHQAGQGAKLTAAAAAAGITFSVTRTWRGGRQAEATFKHRDGTRTGVKHGMARYCPRCKASETHRGRDTTRPLTSTRGTPA